MEKRIIIERRHGPKPEVPRVSAAPSSSGGPVSPPSSRTAFEPFAVVALGDAQYLVDGQGAALKRVEGDERDGLTLIIGLDAQAVEDDPQGAREVLGRALAILDEAERVSLRKRIGELHLRRKGDLLVFRGGLQAHLPVEDYVPAVGRLARTLAHLTARKQKALEIRLNAKDPGHVSVRLAGERGGAE